MKYFQVDHEGISQQNLNELFTFENGFNVISHGSPLIVESFNTIHTEESIQKSVWELNNGWYCEAVELEYDEVDDFL